MPDIVSTLQTLPFPIRVECPPGACVCERERLLDDADADARILRLTREEEKKLVARIELVSTYAQLLLIGQRMHEQLGVALHIRPSVNEVRTLRGISIVLEQRPGLCKKTRQAIPAAIRRCLDKHPDIVFAILNAHDLLGAE